MTIEELREKKELFFERLDTLPQDKKNELEKRMVLGTYGAMLDGVPEREARINSLLELADIILNPNKE